MNEIFFLFFAFLTVFLSIKLSYYADVLSKTGKISNALVGGIVLAGVTSLPEFVTCFTAVFASNPALAMGDVLGSNLFNFFMICVFDLFFVRKMIFRFSSSKHNVTLFLLIVNYVFLFLFCTVFLKFNFSYIGVPSLVIFCTYLFYVFIVSKGEDDSVIIRNSCIRVNNVVLKLIVTAICMVLSSLLLTIIVNNLSLLYPSFSSSFLGAIFLGVTTSLPEVVTFYALINVNNYDLALANIIGSNMFNMLVLALADLFCFSGSIYSFSESGTVLIILFGLVFSSLCLFSNCRKGNVSFFRYLLISLVVVLLYLGFWIVNFLR